MRAETYFVLNGRLSIFKTPTAKLLYGFDLTAWAAAAGTSIHSVKAVPIGVKLSSEAYSEGNVLLAWVEGFDDSPGAENSLTWRFVCADGGTDSRTIHFVKRPALPN